MKAVIFDLDDTLYDQVIPFCEAYEELFGSRFDINIEELFLARHHRSDEVYHLAVRGDISMEEMYIYRSAKPFEDLGYHISEEEALEFQYAYARRQNYLKLSEKMKEILEELKNMCVPVGIISNGPAEHQRNKMKAMGLLNWIPEEHIYVSGDDGISKPEKHIFERARKGFDLHPEEMIMVGDSLPNDIMGAKHAGWKTVWLKRREWENSGLADHDADYMVRTEEELHVLLKELLLVNREACCCEQ